MVNSFYKKRKAKKWTWCSTDGNTKNEIDYFLINYMRIVTDLKRYDLFVFPWDHRALQIKLRIPTRSRVINLKKKFTNEIKEIAEVREPNEY